MDSELVAITLDPDCGTCIQFNRSCGPGPTVGNFETSAIHPTHFAKFARHPGHWKKDRAMYWSICLITRSKNKCV